MKIRTPLMTGFSYGAPLLFSTSFSTTTCNEERILLQSPVRCQMAALLRGTERARVNGNLPTRSGGTVALDRQWALPANLYSRKLIGLVMVMPPSSTGREADRFSHNTGAREPRDLDQ